MDLVTDLLIIGSWLGALVFVAQYTRVNWRATPAGINVMAFMAVIAAVLTLAVIGLAWPDMPGRPTLRLLSWAAIFTVIWHRIWTFRREQRAGRARVRDNHSASGETEQHGT